MNGSRCFVFLLVLATAACSSLGEPIKGYEGPDLPNDRLVILHCVLGCVQIDELTLIAKSRGETIGNWIHNFSGIVTLLPGTHDIEYGTSNYFTSKIGYKLIYATVNLEAGHVYKVDWDLESVSYWRGQLRYIGYIQDTTNSTILAKWSCVRDGAYGRCYPFHLTNSTLY